MFKKSLLCLFVIISLIAVTLPAVAQDTVGVDKSIYYRGILGGGTGSGSIFTHRNSTLGLDLEIMIEKNKILYGIGAKSLSTFNVSRYNNYMQSYDLTIGRVLKSNNLFSSLSLGIAYIEGETWQKLEAEYESKNFKKIGLPISLKGFFVPFRYYGLGVDIYANINEAGSFYGIYFCHQFGLLKKVKKK